MLLDKDVLQALNNKLGDSYPLFDINIFLQLLQSTTRPLGYPPYIEGVKRDYYTKLLQQQIKKAYKYRNGHQLLALLESTSKLLICFSYIVESLNLSNCDYDLIVLLNQAIDARSDTTDEECCAEKACLLNLYLMLNLYCCLFQNIGHNCRY